MWRCHCHASCLRGFGRSVFLSFCANLRRPLRHTPPRQPSPVPSAPKPPLPSPEVAREPVSRLRPPARKRVPLVSCEIWAENLYGISSIEAWWLVFPMAAFCGEWWKLSRTDHFDMDSMIMRYHDKDAVCRNTKVCTCFRPSNEVVLEHVAMYNYRQCVNGILMCAGNHVYNLNIRTYKQCVLQSCILLYVRIFAWNTCFRHVLQEYTKPSNDLDSLRYVL